jgi:nucleotide-binding universal stress UspA family protein
MYRRILVAYDGSEGSRKALDAGIALAGVFGAELRALSVEEHLPRYAATVGEMDEEKAERDRYFRELQARAVDLARERGLHIGTEVRTGQAARVIAEYAQEGRYDLLVIGHSGHSEVWGGFLGSTADKIVRHAPCSVLIVR